MIAPLRILVARARSAHALPLTLATALFAIAAVLPPLPLPGRSYHHMVVLDITQSMNTRDYELNGNPVSRLDYAKHSLAISLRGLPCGSRIGWGVFAEHRLFMLMTPVEVCGNYHELLATLANIDGQMSWAGASEISKGLFSSIRVLKDMEQAPSLVFVTDGHEAPPLNPKMRPSFDGKPGAVKGLVLGAGGETLTPIPKFDPDGAPLGFWKSDEVVQGDWTSRGGGSRETMVDERGKPIEQTTASGTEHLSNLKASHLRDLASQTGMVYDALTSPDKLGKALNNPAFARPGTVPTQLGWIPALIGLLCLVWAYRPDSRRTENAS